MYIHELNSVSHLPSALERLCPQYSSCAVQVHICMNNSQLTCSAPLGSSKRRRNFSLLFRKKNVKPQRGGGGFFRGKGKGKGVGPVGI